MALFFCLIMIINSSMPSTSQTKVDYGEFNLESGKTANINLGYHPNLIFISYGNSPSNLCISDGSGQYIFNSAGLTITITETGFSAYLGGAGLSHIYKYIVVR